MRRFNLPILVLAILVFTSIAGAHCQMPCGIYDDVMRFKMMDENITTIEKSMNEITQMGSAIDKNYNQIVRWVTNKENQANDFMEIVYDYFLAQRIKITDPSDKQAYATYQSQLEMLHQMTVYAMKCKQTTDLANVEKLKELVNGFAKSYLSADDYKSYKAQ